MRILAEDGRYADCRPAIASIQMILGFGARNRPNANVERRISRWVDVRSVMVEVEDVEARAMASSVEYWDDMVSALTRNTYESNSQTT